MEAYEIPQEEKDECAKILERQERMENERATVESTWQECMDKIMPRKADILTARTEGQQSGDDLFDTTATMSCTLLAAFLHSTLTNQTVQFFESILGDVALDADDEVIEWCQRVTAILHGILNDSNFQTEIHEFYLDLCNIGTACLYVGEDKELVAHFAARNMKEIYVDENNKGFIDIVHRKFDWKLRQIVQEFGIEKLPQKMKQLYEKGCSDKFTIIHAVEPKESKDGKYFGFKSTYILKDEPRKLDEKGYKEFPYLVSRWTKISGEKYGRGPGMDMLPDIRMVNAMMETTIKGAQMTVLPPFTVESDAIIGRARFTPGGMTVVEQGMGETAIRPLITNARIDFGYQAVEDVRKRIRAGFFVDKIQLNEGPQKTATEVNQIVEESLRYMGPVLGRQHFEFLRQLHTRLFGLALRANKLPQPPKKIQGRMLTVRYSSLIARAQRTNELTNVVRGVQAAAPLINAFPQALDIIDGDWGVKHIMQGYGAPQQMFKKETEVKKLRDARAQAQQLQAQQMQQAHQADVVSKVGPTAVQAAQAQQQTKGG